MAIRKSKRRVLPAIKQDRQRHIQALLLLLLILIAFSHFRTAFLAQLAMNKSGSMAGFSTSLTDPDALAYLARQEHLLKGNLPRAFQLYQRALSHFVLHVPSWLGLAELYNDMDERDQGVEVLHYVQTFAAQGAEKAWTMALLANDLDSEDILTANLKWLALNQPARRNDVFALADLYWQNPQAVIDIFDPSLDGDLLGHYIRIDDTDKAAAVWRDLAASSDIPEDSTLAYVNFLLRHDRVSEAGSIWRSRYSGGESLLFNPAFQEPLTRSGFGWRINRPEGVSWQPLGGDNGLKILFAGTSNPSFILSQIVPLEPGSYNLTGFSTSDNLTTDQRPYWSVSGFKCKGLSVKGDMLEPTSPRHRFSLSFTVPDECAAVQLSLRRSTSYFFDNKIGGTVVLDGLNLVRTSASSPPEMKANQPRLEATAKKEKVLHQESPPGSTDIRIKKMRVQ